MQLVQLTVQLGASLHCTLIRSKWCGSQQICWPIQLSLYHYD